MIRRATTDLDTRIFDRFFNHALDAMCILGVDGSLKQVNPAFEHLLDFTEEELLSHPFVDLVHPYDRVPTETAIAKLSTSEPAIAFENRCRCKDGTYCLVSWSMGLDPDSKEIYASGRDITERERREHSERESRVAHERQAQFFESILYNLGDIVYAWNRENEFIYGNRRLEEIWGLTPEEFVGKTPADLGYPVDLQELFARQIEQVFDTREAVTGEIPYTSPTNEFGYFEYLFSPVIGDDGSVEFVGGVSRNTTRRRQAEDALRESEDKYRTLFESMDEGYLLADVLFDDDGQAVDILYVDANPAAIAMMGGDPTGKRLSEIDPSYEPYWYEIWGRVAQTGESERMERYAAPVKLWFDFYVFKPEPDNAESRRVAVLFQDVTERRWTEEALRESETRQAFLLELADRLRLLSEPREVITVASEALGQHLGVSQVGYCEVDADQDTVVAGGEYGDGRMPSFVGYRFRLSDYGPGYGPALRAGEDIFYEDIETDPRAMPGGSEEMRLSHVRAGAAVPLNKAGRLVAFLYAAHPEPRRWPDVERRLFRDVAERTWAALERARAEAALRESEARFRESVEVATVGVLFFDFEGRIIDANDAFLKMGSYSREDVEAGRLRWDELTPPEWLPASYRAIAEMETAGETTPYEKEYYRKDGSRWWALFAAKSLGDHGNIEYVLDITERKHADAERERLLAEAEHERHLAEEAVRVRDVFLSIASHELRNPLTTIKASAQLLSRSLQQDLLDKGRGERLTHMLVESSDRLAVLVDDLLDVSRLQSGQLRIDRQPTDLASLVRETVAGQSVATATRRIHLEISDGHSLILDAERIRQVLVNLLDNAIKYSPENSEIRVLLTHDDEGILLRVQDQGIGLPGDAMESIFEPFGRASNAAASNIPGMGLGLYICRGIAEAHNGWLWAESEGEGRGTVMCLRLPAGGE
jgi:PAS domain S-box-containing protein